MDKRRLGKGMERGAGGGKGLLEGDALVGGDLGEYTYVYIYMCVCVVRF